MSRRPEDPRERSDEPSAPADALDAVSTTAAGGLVLVG
jgi:hypothetical protein